MRSLSLLGARVQFAQPVRVERLEQAAHGVGGRVERGDGDELLAEHKRRGGTVIGEVAGETHAISIQPTGRGR